MHDEVLAARFEKQPHKDHKEPPKQVLIDHAVRQSQQDAIHQAEQADVAKDRQSALEAYLVEHDLFGIEPYDPDVLAALGRLLLEAEAQRAGVKPGFDIIDDWDSARVATYLKRKHQTLEASEKANSYAADLATYRQTIASIRQTTPGIDNLSLCKALLDQPELIPVSEIHKIRGFVRIQQLAVTATDQEIISHKINSLNFSDGIPDAVTFIQTDIFADDELSESTQAAISAEFKLERPRPIDTGSEAQSALAETVPGPDGQTSPRYSEASPLPLRPGVVGYARNNRQYIKLAYGDHLDATDTTGWAGEDVGRLIEVQAFQVGVEEFGLTGFLKSVFGLDFNLFGDAGFDPLSLRDMQQTIDLIMGGNEGHDGDIMTVSDRQGYLRYFARLLNPSGTANGFENDQALTDRVKQELELVSADGSPDEKVLREVGRYARDTYLSGEATYADLQAHLFARVA